MAGEYESLNPGELDAALRELRAQLPGMRSEVDALNRKLATGKTSIKDIEAQARKGAAVGAAAKPPTPQEAARVTQEQTKATKLTQSRAKFGREEAQSLQRVNAELSKMDKQAAVLSRRAQGSIGSVEASAIARDQRSLAAQRENLQNERARLIGQRNALVSVQERRYGQVFGQGSQEQSQARTVYGSRAHAELTSAQANAESKQASSLLSRTQSDLKKTRTALYQAEQRVAKATPGTAQQNQALLDQSKAKLQQTRLVARETARIEAVRATGARAGAARQELAGLNRVVGAMETKLQVQQGLNRAMAQAQRLLPAGAAGGALVPYAPRAASGLPLGYPGGPGGGQRPPIIGGFFGGSGGGFSGGGAGAGGGAGRPIGPLPAGIPTAVERMETLQAQAQGTARSFGTLEQAQARYATAQKAATAQTTGFNANLARSQAVLQASSTEMRRFGALTTEFISAAGRGAVTVREMGYQVTSTIGKFGGWLVAGSAVYTAFGAIQAVGRGAIEAESGVSNLQRVVNDLDPSAATRGFRELAGEFNLPISEVTAASFEMGKIFHEQNEALEATRTILASVKVGELDVATSSRYLTSIVQGFNLPVSDMAVVFDQVNQAQNQFGIRIEDTLAGLSKSSGTFRAAGGDLSTLLALITTARRATGQTGEVIGTALSRAPKFLAQDANRQVLRNFGISPTAEIDEIINQAFEIAQGLDGPKVQELANAIFGNLYGARIGTPTLQQGELYQQVVKDTSAEASKGSAEIELQSVLAQTREEIGAIINQLEVLGSNLADAGFLAPFFGLIKLLNTTLGLINNIVDVFNSIPAPIRLALSAFAQLYAVMRLARRLNIGESIGGARAGGGGFLARTLTRPDQENFRYKETLIRSGDRLAQEADTAAQAQVRSALRTDTAKATLGQTRAAQQSLLARQARGEVVSAETITAAKQKVAAAENSLMAAREAELDAINRNRTVLRESIYNQDQLRAIRAGADPRLVRATYGVQVPPSLGPNASAASGLAGQAYKDVYGPVAGDLIRGQNAAIAQDLRSHALRPTDIRSRFAQMGQAMRNYGIVGGLMRQTSLEMREGMTRLRTVGLPAAASRVSSFGTALKNAGKSIAQFFGPVEAFLIGAFLVLDEIGKGKGTIDQVRQLQSNEVTDLAGYEAQIQALREIGDEGSSVVDKIIGQEAAVGEAIVTYEHTIQARQAQLQALRTGGRPNDQRQISENILLNDLDRLKAQSGDLIDVDAIERQLAPLLNEDFLYEEDYREQITRVADLARDGGRQATEGLRNLLNAIRDSQTLTEEVQTELIRDARVAYVEGRLRSGKVTYGEYASLAGEDLANLASTYGKAVGSPFGNREQRLDLIDQALVQGAELIGSRKPENIAELAATYDTLIDAISSQAEAELERALLFARSGDETNKAYAEFFQSTTPAQIKSRSKKLIAEQRRQLQRNRAVISDLQKERKQAQLPDDFIGPADPRSTDAYDKELKDRKENSKKLNNIIEGLRDAEKEAVKRLKEIQREQRIAKFQERQSLVEARTSLRVARANEGLPGIRIQLRSIGRIVERAIKLFGRDSKEVLDLLTQQQGLIDERVQEQLRLIEAQGRLRTAGIPEADTVGRARSELQTLRDQLAFQRAHPRQFSQADNISLEAEIREAEQTLVEDQEQRIEDLRLALFDIKIARAEARGNEVAAARAQLRRALYELRSADDPLARREARASVIEQRASVRDALFNAQIEDIEFQADIGKLTLQQQIRAYQRLLRTAELTRDMRRDLRRRIAQLQDEVEGEAGGFDLRLGDVRLPTIYEIRRAVKGGIDQQSTNVNVNSTNNVTINADGASAEDIFSAFERQANRGNRAALRSAGLT